ncbi:MAG: transcription termination/antitermination protein NusA, partial [Candidatus Staskawiczbacteria bacterium]|nr:transcription termination/antitermination protein NusA [Candidatus Staskawiczbacteria bacterium]
SNEQGVDPIGACVGQRGTRIMAVINELGGEKIDVISWEEKPEKFITNALSPAKVVSVKVEDKNTAIVFVPEDQLSLAIGKDGRNVRLAAHLTGWKIDIKTMDTPVEVVEGEPAESPADNQAGKEKPKKPKKTKKPVRNASHSDAGGEEIGTDGEPVEAEPEEVNAVTEDLPAQAGLPVDNPTEE